MRKRYAANKDAEKARSRAWYASNRGRRYGLTPDEYASLVASNPDGLCPLCRTRKADSVDHNHANGAVRGYICNRCNTALGMMLDDRKTLTRAANYLKRRP
jgi:Recombination endonuclease VII